MPTAPDVADAPPAPRPVQPLEYAIADADGPAKALLTALLAAALLTGVARVLSAVGALAQIVLMVGSLPASAAGQLGALRASYISGGVSCVIVALGLTPIVVASAATLLGRPVGRWVRPACGIAVGAIALEGLVAVVVNTLLRGPSGVLGLPGFAGIVRLAFISAGQLVGVVSGAALPAALWWAAGRPSVAAMLSVERRRGGAGAGGRLAGQ